jgi:hypothetical protein
VGDPAGVETGVAIVVALRRAVAISRRLDGNRIAVLERALGRRTFIAVAVDVGGRLAITLLVTGRGRARIVVGRVTIAATAIVSLVVALIVLGRRP